MKYPEGQIVRVGDLIWWNEGVCLGHVQEIIESQSDIKSWGFSQPHIMVDNNHPLDSTLDGVVAYGLSDFEDEGIGLLTEEELLMLEAAVNSAKKVSKTDLTSHNYSISTECINHKMVSWIFTIMNGNKIIEEIRVPWNQPNETNKNG